MQLKIPKFCLGKVAKGDMFINREQELDTCQKAIINNQGNILILGNWRMGKTSLIYRVKDILEITTSPKLLPIYFNLTAYSDRGTEHFLEDLSPKTSN